MAEFNLTYQASIGDRISGNHVFLTDDITTNTYGGVAYMVNVSSTESLPEENAGKKSASSLFSFPSFDLPKTAVINTLKIKFIKSFYSVGGCEFSLLIDGISYSTDSNGAVSSEVISLITNYLKNGKSSSITIKLDSWVFKPANAEDGSAQTASFTVRPLSVDIEVTCQGNVEILRPCAGDLVIQSGHSFSGDPDLKTETIIDAYKLINEIDPDDASTVIGTEDYAHDGSYECLYTLPALLPQIDFSKKLILSLRPVIRCRKLTESGTITCSVIMNADGALYQAATFTILEATGEEYKTFTGDIANDANIIRIVNSYIKANKKLPIMQLDIAGEFIASASSGKMSDTVGAYITQAYLEIIYVDDLGINVYHNDKGTWKQAQTAYKKHNGIWEEISEEECKSILISYLVTKH